MKVIIELESPELEAQVKEYSKEEFFKEFLIIPRIGDGIELPTPSNPPTTFEVVGVFHNPYDKTIRIEAANRKYLKKINSSS